MQPPQRAIIKGMKPSSKFWRFFFFISGIVATVAYRIIFLLDPFWIEVAWYVGTVGFILYFGHRAIIETKRARMVRDYRLIEALKESSIEDNQKTALLYLTNTSLTSKARLNSAFIFFVSLVVLIINATIDVYYLLWT